MLKEIRDDFKAVFEMDPAATSKLEVLFTYAGFHAILMYRISHWLLRMGMPFFARCVSQFARFLTGIEIHPGAKIGSSFFIDHGMGVVIGETAEIGNHVTLFQGVTLGGTGKERGKRHPSVGDHVVIGTGAKVLGGINIGDHVKVGANAVVLRSVPPHSTVIGVPGRVVRVHGRKITEESMLDHTRMPDPLSETLENMQRQIKRLEQRLGGGEAQPEKGVQKPRKAQTKPRPARRSGRKPMALDEKTIEIGVETAEERQARMAKMEKAEKMKERALKKARDASNGQPRPAAPQAGPQDAGPAKKKVRRRRRPVKRSDKPAQQGGDKGQDNPGGAGKADVSA